MIYYQCECGESKSWNSGMPNYDCQGCKQCGTTYSQNKSGHKELQPHNFETIKETKEVDGKVVTVKEYKQCKDCRTREKVDND